MENNLYGLTLENLSSKIRYFEDEALENRTEDSRDYHEKIGACFDYLNQKEKETGFLKKHIFDKSIPTGNQDILLIKKIYEKIFTQINHHHKSKYFLNRVFKSIEDEDSKIFMSNVVELSSYMENNNSKFMREKISETYKGRDLKSIEFLNKKIVEKVTRDNDDTKKVPKNLIIPYLRENILINTSAIDATKNIDEIKISVVSDLIKSFSKKQQEDCLILFFNNHVDEKNYDLFMSEFYKENPEFIINKIHLKRNTLEKCPSFKKTFRDLLYKNQLDRQLIYNSIRDSKQNELSTYLINEFGDREDIKTHIINSVFVAKNHHSDKSIMVKFFDEIMSKYEENTTYLTAKQAYLILKRCSHSGLLKNLQKYYDIIYKNDKDTFYKISEFVESAEISIPNYKNLICLKQDLEFTKQIRAVLYEILQNNLPQENHKTKKAKI